MTASWNETSLPKLLSNYSLENIYNVDQFGLFFHCLPNKSLQLKWEKSSGGKQQEENRKIRITSLASANAAAEKLSMFVIGKAKNPRCFKIIQTLPWRYRSQKKLDGQCISWRVNERSKCRIQSQRKKNCFKGTLVQVSKFSCTSVFL